MGSINNHAASFQDGLYREGYSMGGPTLFNITMRIQDRGNSMGVQTGVLKTEIEPVISALDRGLFSIH